MASDVRLIYCTFPSAEQASAIARTLVAERLAACVNLVPQVRSIYRWQGAISEDDEVLALIKTTAARLPELQERLLALHPYELPEVIAVAVEEGSPPYLAWVAASCAPE